MVSRYLNITSVQSYLIRMDSKAIGFYIEHKSDKSKNIKACAKSIDELESITGLDFYHNLPDEIETAVEANYKESDWSW